MRRFIADLLTIVCSGLFMHSAYANRYLGKRHYLWLSLLHYLAVGERRGHRPNPFYDPAFARSKGIASLGAYLRDHTLWRIPPSTTFDPVYYRDTAMAGAAIHPLVHFWRLGFDTDRDAARGFETGFFKQVVEFYRRDKKEYAFELLADTDRFVPGTEAALRAKADAFYASIELTIVRRLDEPRNRFLVVIQGDSSYRRPRGATHRSFDVLLNDFASRASDAGDEYEPSLDYVTAQPGTKTTAIRKLMAEAADILLAYDYVLFLDDDIAITDDAIDRLFDTVAAHGLDLAQPSLTPTSFCAFEIIKQPAAGRGLTPLTTIEIMMPVVSKRVLTECGWVFSEGVSGWAVDFLLGVEVRKRFGNRIALIGDVVAAHERAIDTEDGAFYRFLRGHGVEAAFEAGRIARHFDIEVSATAIRRHPAPLDGPNPTI